MAASTLVCVRCLGVHVINVAELQNAGGGMLSKMYQLVAYGKGIKNERRTIKIMQTNPFPAGVASNFAPVENIIFTSEQFEDLSEENGISSALVAEIKCPRDYDCRLTVLISYTSSICAKEMTLATASFTFQQILAHFAKTSSSVFQVNLQSEYCLGAKAYIDLVQPMAQPGSCSIQPFSPPTQRGQTGMNPLRRRFVFYAPDDETTPEVDVEEQAWEPRLVNQVPQLVLESFSAALTRSIDAWSVRRKLEKIRQGLFDREDDAYNNGWQKVTVTVHGAHLGTSKDRDSSASAGRDSRGTGGSSMAESDQSAIRAGGSLALRDTLRNTVSLKTTLCVPVGPGSNPYSSGGGDGGTSIDANSQRGSSGAASEDSSGGKRVHLNARARQSTTNSLSMLSRKVLSSTAQLASGLVTMNAPDDSLPSSFVNVFVDDARSLFSTFLGRTNTEYHTCEPVYGSNINAASVRGASEAPVLGKGSLLIEKDIAGSVFQAGNRASDANGAAGTVAGGAGLGEIEGGGLGGSGDRTPSRGPAKPPRPSITPASASAAGIKAPSTPTTPLSQQSDGIGRVQGHTGVVMTLVPKVYEFRRLEFSRHPDEHHLRESASLGGASLSDPSSGSGSVSSSSSSSSSGPPSVSSSSTAAPAALTMISVQGSEIRFEKFVPYGRRTKVRFEVILEAPHASLGDMSLPGLRDKRGQTGPMLLGTCTLPCIPDHSKEMWIPVELSREYLIALAHSGAVCFDDVMLHVTVSVSGGATPASQQDAKQADAPSPSSSPTAPAPGGDSPVSSARRASLLPFAEPTITVDGLTLKMPASMPTAAVVARGLNGTPLPPPPAAAAPAVSGGASQGQATTPSVTSSGRVLADCYEWLWHVGYDATDPLALALTEAQVEEVLQAGPKAPPLLLVPAATGARQQQGTPPPAPSAASGSPLSLRPLSLSSSNSSNSNSNNNSSSSGSGGGEVERVDVPLPLSWLDEYIHELVKVKLQVTQLLSHLRMWQNDGNTFRSSALKNDPKVQPLPINLHAQLLCLQSHRRAAKEAAGGGGARLPVVSDCLTCGSPSPHALGFKKGGLRSLDAALLARRARLDALKRSFLRLVWSAENGLGGSGSPVPCSGTSKSLPFSPSGPEAALLKEVHQAHAAYESECLPLALRRLLCLSQVLTTVTSGLLLKLALAAEGHVSAQQVEIWRLHGVLFLFEGLLSVSGKERGMLEDTAAVVELARDYGFFVLSFSQALALARKTAEGAGAEVETEKDGETSANDASPLLSSLPWTEAKARQLVDAPTSSGRPAPPEVFLQGRLFFLLLPDDSHEKLPPAWAAAPVLLSVVPVLFSQGVDIQQTVANAASSTSSTYTGLVTKFVDRANQGAGGGQAQAPSTPQPASTPLHSSSPSGAAAAATNTTAAAAAAAAGLGSPSDGDQSAADLPASAELQGAINLRGLWVLDAYCRRVLPESLPDSASPNLNLNPNPNPNSMAAPDGSRGVHSVLVDLDDNIRWSSASKNVEMLAAAERACTSLGGMRVTFCKSGKDRTGMVVTLEQSRVLGEQFRCGMDQARLLRDATVMRAHGTRIDVCLKNIGRRVYSINKLQSQFLPLLLRPPPSLLEDLFKKDLS